MTEQLLPESPSRLVWMREYRTARRLVHLVSRGGGIEQPGLEPLMSWLRAQMRAYVEVCIAQGWDWTRSRDSDRSEMAGWIADDLDLGELLGSPERGRDLATALCQEAGWP